MYCAKCGTELQEEAIFCTQCGSKTNIDHSITHSAKKPETVIMRGLCNRVKSPLFVQNGNAMLTNYRFIYLKHSIAKTLTIGAFVNLTKGSYDFDIPLKNIANIEDGRQGISKTIVINTKNGERYNFYFTNREEWKISLQNVINDSTQE